MSLKMMSPDKKSWTGKISKPSESPKYLRATSPASGIEMISAIRIKMVAYLASNFAAVRSSQTKTFWAMWSNELINE